MNQAVYFSSRVISTINSLQAEDRSAISSALVSEFILGQAPGDDMLNPFQSILYTMIRSYVERDCASRDN